MRKKIERRNCYQKEIRKSYRKLKKEAVKEGRKKK